MRRWMTFGLIAVLATGALAGPVAAQYADVLLPQGVLQVTVEDLPINATTAPEVPVTNPRVAGSLGTGNVTIELAIADDAGTIIRFPAEVNRRGAFRERATEALAPGGAYSLYINDVLIGQFTVAADATGGTDDETGETTTSTLDLARLMPFPQDVGDAVPNLGLVPELSRYQSIAELARVVAQNADNNTAEGRQQARADLTASGFVQRYQGSLAVPAADDPSVFEIQVAAIVTEYDSPETAAAAFVASATGGTDVAGATIGDESRLSSATAVATQTNTEYQSLQLLFRQDRLLVVINYADLLNRAPDQAVVEAMGQAVQGRATAVLAGDGNALTVQSLNLLSSGIPRTATEQYYEAIDGALVTLFNETAESQAARLANLTGGTESSVSRLISRGAGEDETPTAEATAAASPPFLYGVTMVAFADAAAAGAWMDGLADRLAADPLPGYLSFAEVADAPSFGERSAIYESTQQLSGATAAGFRSYVQVGDRVAIIELAAVPETPDAALIALITSQVECLTAGGACAAVNAPTEIVPASADEEGAGNGGGNGQGGGNGGGQGNGNGQGDGGGQGQGDGSGDGQGNQSDLPAGMERETPETE